MWWKRPSILFIILFAIITIILKITFPQKNFISYDNFGYYMHLPAKYIYHDEALSTDWYKKINEKYNSTPTYFQIAQTPKGGLIMRFYKGMSYMWTPAFFSAHYFAKTFNYPADGFSAPYSWALIFNGVIFIILGLIFARKILLHYFSERITTITLFLLFFGTNLFFFTTLGNEVPHVYLFTLFSALIWLTIKWHQKPKYIYALPAGLVYGLIIAIRPSDFFIGIIPVLWAVTDKTSLLYKLQLIYRYKEQLILALIIAAGCFLPQLLYYRVYAGEYFLNIYNDPASTIDLSNPRFAYVLFGFRKGWFIYSPLSLLGFAGLILCYRRCRKLFFPSLLFLLIVIYLIASFTSLTSYGYRAFIQSYAVLVIPTGALIEYLNRKRRLLKAPVYALIATLTILSIHQAYQLYAGVIDGSRMTKAYYFKIIGTNHRLPENERLLLIQRSVTPYDSVPKDRIFIEKELISFKFESETSGSLPIIAHSGHGAFKMGQGVEYSPDLKIKIHDITKADYCFIRSEVYVYSDTAISDDFFIVITTMNAKNEHVKYRTAGFSNDLNKFIPGQWNKVTLEYLTPEPLRGNEIIQTLAWYRGNSTVWIDDFRSVALIEK